MKKLQNLTEILIDKLYQVEDLTLEQTYVGKMLELSSEYPLVFVNTDGEGLNIKNFTDEDFEKFVFHSLTEREFLMRVFRDPLVNLLFEDFKALQEFYTNDPVKAMDKFLKLKDEIEYPLDNLQNMSKFSFLEVGLELKNMKLKFTNTLPKELKEIIHSKYPDVNIYNSIPSKFLDKVLKEVRYYSNTTVLSNTMKAAVMDSSYKEIADIFLKELENMKDVNFITIKADKNISYLPKGKMLKCSSDGVWISTGRQQMKPHKFFNRILTGHAKEYDIKCFVDELLTFSRYKVEFVKGKEIGDTYRSLITNGWATTSCMHDRPLEWFEIYTDNDHAFELGLIKDNATSEIVGRFLKVNAVTCDEEIPFTYNDRLYYKSEEILAFYNAYTDDMKMMRKKKNSADTERDFYHVDRGDVIEDIKVILNKNIYEYSGVPYMDTLPRGYKNIIANNISCFNKYTTLWTTDGALENDFDEIHDEFIGRGDAVIVEAGEHVGKRTAYFRTISENGLIVYKED